MKDNLEAIRLKTPGKVIWIQPQDATARAIVISVATRHEDATVGFVAGSDHVHPKSYEELAASIRRLK